MSELLTPIYNFMYKRNDGRAWRPTDFYKASWQTDEEVKEQPPEEELQARLDRLKKIFPDK